MYTCCVNYSYQLSLLKRLVTTFNATFNAIIYNLKNFCTYGFPKLVNTLENL